MSKLNDMSMKDILSSTDLILKDTDAAFFCNDIDAIKEYCELIKSNKVGRKEVEEFLIKHERSIDKQKLVLLLIYNYQDNINHLSTVVENNEKFLSKNIGIIGTTSSEMQEQQKLKMQLLFEIKNLNNLQELGKGMNKFITKYTYNKEKNRYELQVIESRDIIEGKPLSPTKNLRRFYEVDKEFVQKEDNKDEMNGIEVILQSIVLTDFREIFPDNDFGECIRSLILDNNILESQTRTKQELETIKATNYQEYVDIFEAKQFQDLLPDIKNTIEKYIKYVDMDKLLMISAYRFEEALENGVIKAENMQEVKEILTKISHNIKCGEKVMKYQLQDKKTYDLKEVSYSIKDIRRCIRQFSGDTYLTKQDIKENREKVNSGEMSLSEVNPDYVSTIFSVKDLEELARKNDENFTYVANKLHWEKEKILQVVQSKNEYSAQLVKYLIAKQIILPEEISKLYMDKKLGIEQMQNLTDIVDLKKQINPYELIQYYIHSIEEQATEDSKDNNNIEKKFTEENKDKYNRYLELYKNIINKNSSDMDFYSNELMERIIENYDENNIEQYMQYIENFYKEGLLTLNTLIEWNDEDTIKELITRLHNSNTIDLEDIKQLTKERKLPFEYIEQLIWKEDISYEERMKILEEGWIPEEQIAKLFSKALICEADLYKLAKKSIIRDKTVKEIIDRTTLGELEENAAIVLEVSNSLQKIKSDNSIYSNGTNDMNATARKKPKLIIDPNERRALFSLLGAYVPNKVKIDENSPFYNYEFYVIPDESGKVNQNSVVIAERIYEDKNDENSKFATNNATYFFKYKDLMVLSNYLKKNEVIEEKENIVFKANHGIASEKKNGHWAVSVIYGIAKTMLSSDLKEYSKQNQRKIVIEKLSRMYSYDSLRAILDKAGEIDSGEYIGEIVEQDSYER